MPIVVNGTTIPENVANVLNVNGTNITSVVCNGVTVWTQSLNLVWSGSSIAAWSTYSGGLETSGNAWRFFDARPTLVAGAWQSVSLAGVFSGNSSLTGIGIYVSGSSLKMWSNLVSNATFITYDSVTKTFASANSSVYDTNDDSYELSTSGGLIRYYTSAFGSYGQYISLA